MSTPAQHRPARGIADELVGCARTIRLAEARQLELVCELAEAYRSGADLMSRPGGPRLVASGADGTPAMDEFLVRELHPLLGVSAATAWALIRDATNLRHRHHDTWALVQDGTVPAWQARQVARDCSPLSADAAAWVDARIALAIPRLPWARAKRKLAGLIVAADTASAAERAAEQRRDRFVSIRHSPDGTSWLLARLKTPDAVRLAETIHALAGSIAARPGYDGTLDMARSDALGELATGAAELPGPGVSDAPAPPALLVVHVKRDALRHPDPARFVGRVEGGGGLDDIGPALLDDVRDLLGHRRVRVLPVIDLAGDPSVDAYEVPDRMRAQVVERDSYSTFPFSARRARDCDLDHTRPYQWAPGARSPADGPADGRRSVPAQTRPSNLGSLDRASHRAKTHAGWAVRQVEPGVFTWTSPLGYRYTVDRHGTRRNRGTLQAIPRPIRC